MPVSKSLVLEFVKDSEKGQTWRYRETEPGMVIGGFYFSKVAMYFWQAGKAPARIKVTIEPMEG